MKSNYTQFTRAFNTLHETIEERIGEKYKNFGGAYNHALKKKDYLIERHQEKIDFYREFRNILTHKATLKQPPFAEPSDHLIADILKTIEDIKNPSKVREVFLSEVKYFQVEDMLTDVLEVVRKENYSQFPIFDKENLIGLISENGITSFLAESVEEDIISIKEITIMDVLNTTRDEGVDAFIIVNTNEFVYEIENKFLENTKRGNARFTILVSHSANKIKKPADIAGIITPWDMPKVSKYSHEKIIIN